MKDDLATNMRGITRRATFEVGKAGATRDYDNAVAKAGVDYVSTLAPEEKAWFLGYVDPLEFGYGPNIDTATADARTRMVKLLERTRKM